MWTILALLIAAPVQADQAWTLGYTGYVKRACGGWDQRADVIPLSALPDARTLQGEWGENGPMTRAYRSGLAAARSAQEADPGFCEHPARRAAPHATLVERVLVRVAGDR